MRSIGEYPAIGFVMHGGLSRGRAPARSLKEVEAENRTLREELQRVKNQRDILKKTLGIISAPPDGGLSA